MNHTANADDNHDAEENLRREVALFRFKFRLPDLVRCPVSPR